MRSILFLSTYPIVKPMHGGQIRVRKLVDYFLKKNWNVKHIAIYEEETYHKEDVSDSDIAFPVLSSYREYNSEKIPFITDYLSGVFSTNEPAVFNKVLSLLPDSLDIIQVEQLWLWPLAEKIKRHEKYSNVKLVLSSHNIEYELKERIFGKYNLNKFGYIIDKIKDLEKYAASKADLICAVTEYDANVLSDYGVQEVIVAPNAVEPWNAKDEKIRYWSNKLPKSPWMLYVASAHPPNFTDFNECVGHSLACIPPDSKLVVVGSVCEHLYTEVSKSKWSNLNTSRLLLLDKLADEDLDAVKTLAHSFLLPIVEGGGSNLKTAEALYSGGYVVSTPQALRGFTRFIDTERVKVFNSPAEFHSHSRDILSRNKYQITDDDINNMHSLTWDASIDKLYISFEYMLRVI